jgi:hypothetical protein
LEGVAAVQEDFFLVWMKALLDLHQRPQVLRGKGFLSAEVDQDMVFSKGRCPSLSFFVQGVR